MSEGTDAIVKYFMPGKGSGNKNSLGERRTIVLGDNAVVVAGFYEFTRMQEGKPVPAPSRFTMLVVKRDGEWRIAHHHSSPHVQPKQVARNGIRSNRLKMPATLPHRARAWAEESATRLHVTLGDFAGAGPQVLPGDLFAKAIAAQDRDAGTVARNGIRSNRLKMPATLPRPRAHCAARGRQARQGAGGGFT